MKITGPKSLPCLRFSRQRWDNLHPGKNKVPRNLCPRPGYKNEHVFGLNSEKDR